MRYGLLVLGPAGSGKSTFCNALQQHMEVLHRSCSVVNLDPAAEFFLYKPCIDVRELITVEEAATELALGPNGALVYAMEFLQQHVDWLEEQLLQYGEDTFFVFDCPGQIELYTHLPLMKNICISLQRAGLRLAACCCLDISFMTDAAKLFGGSLMALSAMVQLELPHINLLTKCDLVARHLASSHLSSSSSEASSRRRTRCRRVRRDRTEKGTRRTQVQIHSMPGNTIPHSRRPNCSSCSSNCCSCGGTNSDNRSNSGPGNTCNSSSSESRSETCMGECTEDKSAGGKVLQHLRDTCETNEQQRSEGQKDEEVEQQLLHQLQKCGGMQKKQKQWRGSGGVDASAGDVTHAAEEAAKCQRRRDGSASSKTSQEEEEEEEVEEEEEEEEDDEEEEEEEEDENEGKEKEGRRKQRAAEYAAGRLSRGIGFGMLSSLPSGFRQDGNKDLALENNAATSEETAKERAIDALLSRDPQQLLQKLDECTPAAYRNLNAAFAALLEDYNLVSFLPCDITEEDSLSAVALVLEQTLQYGEDLEVRETDIRSPD